MHRRGAAVAMLGLDGNYFSPGPKGVVRLTQVDTETCLVEGTLDGLSPGLHSLAIANYCSLFFHDLPGC